MRMEAVLRDTINRSIRNNEVAGVSVLVQKGQKEVCFLAEGMADVENNKKIERDTIFRLFSQTKPICASAAMILMERGRLDLCQPVSDFLPGFKNQKVWENGADRPVIRGATVYDLLRMTSGSYYPDESCESARQSAKVFGQLEERFFGENPMTTIELANALGHCSLDFEPGSSWNYGPSADILGAVIEVVSGKKLGRFLKEEIFEPLGMEDTAFWVPEEKRSRLSKFYETVSDENGNRLIPYKGNHLGIQNGMEREPAFESGGAGLVSTLDDYMKFARMLLNGGTLDGKQILRQETVKYMTDGKLSGKQQEAFEEKFGLTGYSYGNLMRVCKNPSEASVLSRKSEYGWDGWSGMYFVNCPGEELTILIGMQKKAAGLWPLTRKLRNVILSYI